MATRAQAAIRQETATSRIIGAATRIGIEGAELRTNPRNAEEQLAETLEQCATMMEAAAEVIERMAAGETVEEARRVIGRSPETFTVSEPDDEREPAESDDEPDDERPKRSKKAKSA